MSSRPTDGATASRPGLLAAVRTDLTRLHAGWMGLAFPRQGEAAHPVLGRWRPTTLSGRLAYGLWSAVGVVVTALAYPLAVVGFGVRYQARRIGHTAATLGVLGVVLLSALGWGALTALAYVRGFSGEGVVAVAAGGGVATVSAVLALWFARVDGRLATVVFAYPFGVTAIFLPPVVAALYSPALADVIFPNSYSLAVWILDNPLSVAGVGEFLREEFQLVGVAYVGMWFGIAVPVGWALGLVVTLANVVRPRGRRAAGSEAT